MRRFEFAVDRDHTDAVNETLAAARRRRLTAALATLVLGAGAALLVLLDRPWGYILAVVFALAAATGLWVALMSPRGAVDIERRYAEGELVPAIVAEVHQHGATLLALVDLAKSEASGARYAFVIRKVHALPGHRTTPGERVPAVGVPVERASLVSTDLWQTVDPMPIAWATRDATVIRRAEACIGEVEWTLLADNVGLTGKVRAATAGRLLLDPHQLPKELRSQ